MEQESFVKPIWNSLRGVFEKKVKVLNKILSRNGLSPITYAYGEPYAREVKITRHAKGDAFANDTEDRELIEFVDVTVSGAPTIVRHEDAPYRYIGNVTFDEDGVKHSFCKDKAFETAFTTGFRKDFCDHCGTRRNRKAYYMFENGGKVVQIGSTCAAGYFGLRSAKFLSAYGETFIVDYEGTCPEDFEFSKGSVAYEYDSVFRAVAFATSGFTRWNKACSNYDMELPLTEIPTTDAVRFLLSNANKAEMPDTKTEYVTMGECLAFWRAKELDVFADNCVNALRLGYVTARTLGIVAYAIYAAVKNAYEVKAARATAGERAPCPYAEGARVDVAGTVSSFRQYEAENNYGPYGGFVTKYAMDFRADDGGTMYRVVTSSATFRDVKDGDRVSIRGTVGNKKEYKGVEYTYLLRPKLAEGKTEAA